MAADAAVLANEFPEKSFEGFLTGQFGSIDQGFLYNLPRLT